MVESRSQAGRIVRFGAFELDRLTGELRKNGLRLSLQDQPLQVLTILLERPGELVTREELRQRLWPADTFVDFEQGLNAAVKRLRSVLGDSADVPRFVETLPRRGYRWTCPAETVGPLPDGEQTAAPSAAPVRAAPRRTKWLVLAAALAAAAVVAFTWRKVAPPVSRSAGGVRVLPLTNLEGVASDPALSPDGNRVAFCWDGDGEPGVFVKRIGDDRQVHVGEGAAGVFSPTWSPDGQEIAFLRHRATDDSVHEIVVVPVAGGSERRLGTSTGSNHGLDWSPDGRLLAFVEKASPEAPDAIHLLETATGERQRLTTPVETSSRDAGDFQPSFSPDGRSLAFIRRGGMPALSTEIYVQDIGSSVSRPLTTGFDVRDVGWAADGRSLVFVAGRPRLQGNLWTVDAGGGQARVLSGERDVRSLSTTRAGRRLAFERRVIDTNIWRVSGPAASRPQPPQPLLRGPRGDSLPDYSPDGTRIAFASGGGPHGGIVTCRENGSDCIPFKSEVAMSAPRWSFNGESIAAVGFRDDAPIDVYRLDVAGHFARRLTTDNAQDTMPSWSRDGRWLYFASNRTGTFELWKMPSGGGEARRLTKRGGALAQETADGRWIYFVNRVPIGSLWKMPSDGGDETLVLDTQIFMANWALWRDRIIYVDDQGKEEHRVAMFDPSTRRTTKLAVLEKGRSRGGMAVSPDGAWILYTRHDQASGEVLMLEGLK